MINERRVHRGLPYVIMSADQVFELIKPIVMDVLLLHLTDQMMEDWEADSQ